MQRARDGELLSDQVTEAVIVYVAGKMIWEGWHEVQPYAIGFAGL